MPTAISTLLLTWYDAHARVLPWRTPPGQAPAADSAYHTWVSEIMLQQTRVETVIGYYARFLERFPTLAALASAPEDEVLKMWEGLGYYSRARNLHKGAQQVMADHGGLIPKDAAVLRTIQGVGPYTAGAIASIAYGQPVPAVDGNVIRVVSRLKGIRENVGIPSVRRMLEGEAASLVPADRPGDFNQAMMDLGATICTPGTPSCDRCPLHEECDAYQAGDAEDLPVLPRKAPPKVIDQDVCLIFSGERVLMRQRTEAMLQGLWVFPMVQEHHPLRQLPAAVKRLTKLPVSSVTFAGDAKHVFTHQIWQMKLYTMTASATEAPPGWRFVTLAEMDALALPTAVKAAAKVAREILAGK